MFNADPLRDLQQDPEVFIIFGAAAVVFLGVMGWGMWRDHRDEKEGKKG